MKKTEIAELFKYLHSYYQKRFDIPTDENDLNLMINTWYDFLSEYNYQEIMIITKKLISRKEWPPTPGEIAYEIERIKTPREDKLTAGEAWEKVLQAISEHSYFYNPKKVKNVLPEKARKAAEVVGFSLIAREGAGNTYLFNSFKEAYNNLSDKQDRDRLLPGKMREEVNKLVNKFTNPQIEGEVE